MDLIVDLFGNLIAVLEKEITDFRGDTEPTGDGYARLAHLREASTLATKDVAHFAVTVGGASAERIYVFLCQIVCLLLSTWAFMFVTQALGPSVTISEKSAMIENSVRRL